MIRDLCYVNGEIIEYDSESKLITDLNSLDPIDNRK